MWKGSIGMMEHDHLFCVAKWCGCAKISCFLENHVPHINVPAEFNQDMSESARERRNRL
jgi:hypothetical protein